MLGETIKKLRQEKNLSRASLGNIVKLTGRCIENIESGKITNPNLDTVKKLSEFFEISIDELIK